MRFLALLAITGCASHATVVEIPTARPLPAMPPAEIVEAEPSTGGLEPRELTEIEAIDFDDSSVGYSAPVPRPAPTASVRCAPGTIAVAGACLTPAPKTAAIPNGCTLTVNSIPSSHVLVDGVYVGPTPQLAVNRAAGTHTVMFITDDASAKKLVTVKCVAGEKKMVAVRVRDP